MRVFQFNPGTRVVMYGTTALVYLFVFAPIFFVIYASFDPNEIMSFPYKGFSLRWYSEFFGSAVAVIYLVFTGVAFAVLLAGRNLIARTVR